MNNGKIFHVQKTDGVDPSLAANQCGVFLGFANAPALKIASAAIYVDLASHQSVNLLLQPNTLGKRMR